MARRPFAEYPVRLGDRGMRTVPMIGSTPNALNLPRVHFDPKSKPEQHMADISANFAAIQRAVNNLPVPTVGTGFLDVVDGWVLQGERTGAITFNVENLLADQDYDITAGVWLVIGSVVVDLDPIPAKLTGAQVSLDAGGYVQLGDNRSVGSVQGYWNGENDTGWDYPAWGDQDNSDAFLALQASASTFGLMRDAGTDTVFNVQARQWTLDEPGTPGDPDENGSKDTTVDEASWSFKFTGYRMSDERFNEATEVDGSDWPTYDI